VIERISVKGGSLFFVIVISIVLAIITTNILLVIYFQLNLVSEHTRKQKLAANLQSGINITLEWRNTHQTRIDTTFDLYRLGSDSLSIKILNWGLFDIGIVDVADGKWHERKLFLFGSSLPDSLNKSIYLTDLDRPLTISGETQITGNASLPKAGIRAGSADGFNYTGESLINGKQYLSGHSLPKLNKEWLIPYFEILSQSNLQSSSSKKINHTTPGNIVFNPFSDSTLYYTSQDTIILNHINFSGNIRIYSAKEIEVDSTVTLNDIILIAPKIIFKGHFSGVVQAFASDSLVIEENCSFNYPSALVLLKDSINRGQPVLDIGSNNTIQGIILSQCQKKDINLTIIRIGRKTSVEGIIYCNGYLDLSGIIAGIVCTDNFIHKGSSTIFENYLINARVNRLALSKFYVGSSLFFDDNPDRKVIKWLN